MALIDKLINIADAIRTKTGKTELLTLDNMATEIAGIINFDVVGNPQPTSPSENTIWLNTDVPITGYEFSATEPSEPVEGIVWISVGTSSPVAFSATKKDPVMVYPISAKQYVDGAWVNVEAKSYQNGAFVDWVPYIIHGGIINIGFSANLRKGVPATFTPGNGYIAIKGHTSGDSKYATCALTDEKIDLTNVESIKIDLDVTVCGTDASQSVFKGVSLVVANAIDQSTLDLAVSAIVAFVTTKATGRQTMELDVKGIAGEYYIGLAFGYSSTAINSANVFDFWIEVA